MKNILVLSANPNIKSLNHSLAVAYAAAAEKAGHEVELVHVPSLEFERTMQPGIKVEQVLLDQQDLFKKTDHLAVFTPVWQFALPSDLKAYFERVLVSGFAFRYPHKLFFMRPFMPHGLLSGRSVRLVTTQDSYRFVSWAMGNPFLISIPLSTFFFVGIWPLRRTIFTRVRKADPAKRQNWISKIERLGSLGK